MPSMRAVLEKRGKCALVRVEELRAEFERIRTALAEAEDVLNHRVIGLAQYLEALAEQETLAAADPAETAAAQVAGEEPVVTRPCRTVARKQDGVAVDVLGADYRRIMTALDQAGGSLTARQTAVALGWDSSVASRVEGARSRLKRLVERGWLVEDRPGRFTLPASEAAADAEAVAA